MRRLVDLALRAFIGSKGCPLGLVGDLPKVAAFVSECLDYRRFEASDLLPYATRETLEELGLVGFQIDTFSSDSDDYIDESGMVYDAHGA